MPSQVFIYPTNNFGNRHNVRYYHYNSFVLQGRNFTNFNCHQVQLVNNTSDVIQIVDVVMTKGRLNEDFPKKQIVPGSVVTAYFYPDNLNHKKCVQGAVVLKSKGKFYTCAFTDEFIGLSNQSGVKGYIEQGNDVQKAINSLRDDTAKSFAFGGYQYKLIPTLYNQVKQHKGKNVFYIGAKRL